MSDAILTSEASSKSSNFNSNSRIICRVCEKQFSQYTCPRCNIRYCSLPCYKSHSLRCTESFMRENVMEELQQVQPDEESKSKMLDILKRFREEEETDSLDEDESNSSLTEETIQKIFYGGQISLNDLSAEERKHFQRAVASGELSKLIEPWDPWWLKPCSKYISLSSDGTQLVQPIVKEEELGASENDLGSDKWHHDIPPGPKSPLPPKLIQTAERELKSEKLLKSKKAELKSKLKSADRKIYFIMCWIHEQPSEAWSSLAAILNTEKSSAMEYADSKRSSALRLGEKTERGGKPLIKEVQ